MSKVNQGENTLIKRRVFLVGIVVTIVLSLLGACAPKIIEKTTELPVTTLTTIAPTLPTSVSTMPTASPTTSTTTLTTSKTTSATTSDTEISLLAPEIMEQSVEVCLNSRESTGTNTGILTTQQLSNILWAVGKAPMVGPTRTIVVTTQAGIFGTGTGGTYSYNPDSHSLTKFSDIVTTQSAFMISWDIGKNGLTFDAGLIYMPALLAAVSSWGSPSQIWGWPRGEENIFFGADRGLTLKTECVAISSVPKTDPGYLPNPSTTGTDNIANVLANLKYTNSFSQTNLTLQQISQLLWAGYGCTPHKGTKGITTPSAMDWLYLTGTIYLVNGNGVFRYHNRKPTDNFYTHPDNYGNFFNTRDHRLEQIGSSDVRTSLQSMVSGLPKAPCYIILSLDDTRLQTIKSYYSDTSLEQIKTFANLETGFVAFNYLLQASAMGLGCNFKTQLTSGEQGSIQSITSIPSSYKPQVVVSIGGIGK